MAITISNIKLFSNNNNPKLAGIYDTVFLTFDVDETVILKTIELVDDAFSWYQDLGDGQKWVIASKINKNSKTGVVEFAVEVENGTGDTASIDEDDSQTGVTVELDASTIPKYADQSKVYEDIGKLYGNFNRDNLVTRADEDASSKLQSIFLNNVDFTELGIDNDLNWFVDLATKLTTAIFWKKGNGTQDQKEEVEKLLGDAATQNYERFFPVEYN